MSYISASECNHGLLKSPLVVDDFGFFKKGVFLFVPSELWWWDEASTQHHGSRNARSQHVSLFKREELSILSFAAH